jgi:hypothetical protein
MTDFEQNIKRNVDQVLFKEIRDHKYGNGENTFNYTYGQVASWLTWNRNNTGKLKGQARNTLDWWDGGLGLSKDRQFLERLTTDIVFVGLNMSRNGRPEPGSPLFNNARGVRRIINTFINTKAEGGYFTDIIKPDRRILNKLEEKGKAAKVRKILDEYPEILKEHIRIFKDELNFIGSVEPLLIVFGDDAYYFLEQGFKYGIFKANEFIQTQKIKTPSREQAIIKIWHYSNETRKKEYEYINHTSDKLAKYITIPKQAIIEEKGPENPYLQELNEAKYFFSQNNFKMTEPTGNSNLISCKTIIHDTTFYIASFHSRYEFSWRKTNPAGAKKIQETLSEIKSKYPTANEILRRTDDKTLSIPLDRLEDALKVIKATRGIIGYTG